MEKQIIAYSILELAIVSQGNTIRQALKNALALAKEAEACNYKRIWFAEHHNSDHIGSSATAILIGYVAENTDTIRVGSGGIMLPNHSPFIVAEQFGTLAHLYAGRIDLGLGRAPGRLFYFAFLLCISFSVFFVFSSFCCTLSSPST